MTLTTIIKLHYFGRHTQDKEYKTQIQTLDSGKELFKWTIQTTTKTSKMKLNLHFIVRVNFNLYILLIFMFMKWEY